MIATPRIVAMGGAGALVAVALGLIVHGTDIEGWSAATRWTARWSVIPFALTFAASGLLPRVRGRWREWLRNRAGWGSPSRWRTACTPSASRPISACQASRCRASR